MTESSHVSSVNPWSTQDSLLGVRLGDPQSALALARRHGLLGITQVGPEGMDSINFVSMHTLHYINTHYRPLTRKLNSGYQDAAQ